MPTPTTTPIPPGAPQTLTLWITEVISPSEGGDEAQIFEQQIAAFEATHPGLTVQVLYKKPEGKGGIQDFLTTASAVAPAAVPDLIAIDIENLPDVARKGVLVPLGELLSPSLQGDLYPFVIRAGTVDGQLMGVQFEIDIEHTIYNTSKIAVPPLTWTDVFSSGATYIFPSAGQDGLVNDAFLIQYLSTGGELVDSNGNPALNQQALEDVLEFYQQGIANGAILTDVLNYATVETGWPKYLQAEVVMSNISSKLYLAGPGSLPGNLPAAIPSRDGQAVALGRGYAWALTTRDVNRLPLTVKLLEWLMYPAYMAAWSQAAEHLPTRRAAFDQVAPDPYVAFVSNQLEYVVPYPSSEIHQRIYRAMQQAVDAVLREGVLPEIAAENVLKAVNQETLP
jgi:multiple sugar transport system substrate-binding protein